MWYMDTIVRSVYITYNHLRYVIAVSRVNKIVAMRRFIIRDGIAAAANWEII